MNQIRTSLPWNVSSSLCLRHTTGVNCLQFWLLATAQSTYENKSFGNWSATDHKGRRSLQNTLNRTSSCTAEMEIKSLWLIILIEISSVYECHNAYMTSNLNTPLSPLQETLGCLDLKSYWNEKSSFASTSVTILRDENLAGSNKTFKFFE